MTGPARWCVTRVGDHCRIQNGFPFKSEFFSTNKGVPLIRVRSLKTQSCDIRFCGEYDENFLVENGSILIGMDGDFQPCSWKGGTALLNQRVCRLKDFSHDVEPHFFYEALKKPLRGIEEITHFTTVKHISSSTIESIGIVLPPLDEQRAIARALQRIQKAKEARQRELELERERKAALMEYLFAHGTRGEPTKQTEIGEVPESWQFKPLGECTELITKGASPNWQGFEYSSDGIIFVRSQNVGWGRLELKEVAYLPPTFNDKEKKSTLRADDLLVNIVGASIGRAALATERVAGGNVNQAVAIIRLRQEECDPVFTMNFIFTAAGQERLQRQKKDIARANLSLQDLADLLVPVPSVAEQHEIAAVMSAVDKKIDSLENETTLLEELFQTMLEELVTGRLSAVPLIE